MSQASEDKAATPPLQLVVYSSNGIQFIEGPLSDVASQLSSSECMPDVGRGGGLKYSADGVLLAIYAEKSVQIYDSVSKECKLRLDGVGIEKIEFSPKNSYLAVYERRSPSAEKKENLSIFSLQDGKVIRSFSQKEVKESQWPPFGWSSDEAIFAQMVTNQVNIYEAKSLGAIVGRLRFEKLSQFSLAPGFPYRFAVAKPVTASKPAQVAIFTYPKLEAADIGPSRSFYKADEIVLKWSPTGHALLIETTTLTSDQSYYGETNLFLLHADGSFDCTVPFGSDKGPIQDVRWSPHGREFLVIQGQQPAQGILFLSDQCKPKHHFGRSSSNTIRFSPHGRFVMIGGFGNCAGDMQFFDINKKKMMGVTKDINSPSAFEWTPDGRHFITSTLYARMKVDNGLKVWTYYGQLLHYAKFERLYQVAIRPALPGVYPDRPQSPQLKDRMAELSAQQQAPAKKAYVPPSLRARGGVPSDIMKRGQSDGPRSLGELQSQIRRSGPIPGLSPEAAQQVSNRRIIPGAPQQQPLSKSALKKQKQKAKKQAEAEAKQTQEAIAGAAEESSSQDGKAKPSVDLGNADVVEKRLKAVQKKLRQVKALQEKRAAGQSLDQAAQEKLATEPDLTAEVAQLTAALAALGRSQ